jgi:dephospho-CoA kinase
LGAHVIDADALVHQLERRGAPVYEAIVTAFGPGILRQGGEIDRARLGARVFSDPAALACLEAIVHPAVGEAIERQLSTINYQLSNQVDRRPPITDPRPTTHDHQASSNNIRHPIVVIEAIKLIETGRHKTCNVLWVVTAPYQVQLERLRRTRGLSEAEARARIEAQPPQSEKIALANVVIDNSGDLEHTRAQVIKHHQAIVCASL